jgi:hypothetical protein
VRLVGPSLKGTNRAAREQFLDEIDVPAAVSGQRIRQQCGHAGLGAKSGLMKPGGPTSDTCRTS